jgi:HK97 family phage major capsid protein
MKKLQQERVIETRSMPSLLEQRNNLITEMEGLIAKAKEETRSMSDDEGKRYDEIKNEINNIDKTIQAEQEQDEMKKKEMQQAKTPEQEEKRALEEKNFINFLKGDTRALDVATNGAIIPTDIANRIITRVKELSPIYQRATVFNVGGDLVFPSFDSNSIVTEYIGDLEELTAQVGSFSSRKLQNFIAGSLVLVSRSLMNRTEFDLITFVVNTMAQSIANFIEKQLLIGGGSAVGEATGLFTDANVTSLTSGGTAWTTDDLISAQLAIPEQFQNNAVWIMNKATFGGLRKLKDANGQYMLQPDIREGFGWSILGRPVYISENAPTDQIAYGDMSGLYMKLSQGVEVQVLNEKYATQHATGVVGYIEFDCRVIEDQRIAVMTQATA